MPPQLRSRRSSSRPSRPLIQKAAAGPAHWQAGSGHWKLSWSAMLQQSQQAQQRQQAQQGQQGQQAQQMLHMARLQLLHSSSGSWWTSGRA
jgi:hypothetical protein